MAGICLSKPDVIVRFDGKTIRLHLRQLTRSGAAIALETKPD
jgi:hypothetical protein